MNKVTSRKKGFFREKKTIIFLTKSDLFVYAHFQVLRIVNVFYNRFEKKTNKQFFFTNVIIVKLLVNCALLDFLV